MSDCQIKISKPAAYNRRMVITYEVFFGFGPDEWKKNREFLLEKWPDSKTWNVLERKTAYTGRGFTADTQTAYYGKDLSLRDARKLCVSLIERYIRSLGKGVEDNGVVSKAKSTIEENPKQHSGRCLLYPVCRLDQRRRVDGKVHNGEVH